MTAIVAWAIKAPDGNYVVSTRNDTEEKAWNSMFPDVKEMAKSRGWYCVRVRVEEIESTAAKEE